ncbi:floral homeotic protein DEFICIENS isoform X2 [Beta vulgaris subsp. vulgaris]|uniref:floral homeotic protein DEFICIENS isoform X2 n=1 Tax=Beta vulgaris subsp. vulgaris TaxID=3555 RepID=UPI002036920A|nr:floral homeotic protein DEFICIENS isoform X2 [Beta vulgaris subsp. vulgaris]
MARGKIQIKKIENQTNRQVTYSKRRNGLFKKANELTVLCDATVSIIMVSNSNKIHEYISPGNTTKEIYDRYQKDKKVDVWMKQYQKMQQELMKLNETNRELQRDIRRRMGDCLEDLTLNELCCLGQEVNNSVTVIRERKMKKLDSQIDTTKKKVISGLLWGRIPTTQTWIISTNKSNLRLMWDDILNWILDVNFPFVFPLVLELGSSKRRTSIWVG